MDNNVTIQWQRLVKSELHFIDGFPEPHPHEEWEDIPEEDKYKYPIIRYQVTVSGFTPSIVSMTEVQK